MDKVNLDAPCDYCRHTYFSHVQGEFCTRANCNCETFNNGAAKAPEPKADPQERIKRLETALKDAIFHVKASEGEGYIWLEWEKALEDK